VGTERLSSYLDHLPALFRADPSAGRFLLAFEAVLSGLPGADGTTGLEQTIGRTAEYLDPQSLDEEFLPWLAGWVSLSLRADWPVRAKQRFIGEIVPLYRKRGTKAGLKRMLEIYLRPDADDSPRDDVMIHDDFRDPPHFFQVQLRLGDSDPALVRRTQRIARAIIDREKPAHTCYALRIVIPTMRLGDGLVLGENTWLGTTDAT
jgi:phage tail-like protein